MAASALVRQLVDAGVHFGHQTKRWNPKMKQFIFGSRSGIYIIDLEKTEQHLKAACAFVEDLASRGELVLFVGTKKPAKAILKEEATRCGMLFVVTRWLGGTLTNFNTVKRNINRLLELRRQKQAGAFAQLSKRDAKRCERHLEKLEVHFSGLAGLDRLPACLYIVDPKREQNAVYEANRLEIPIVAICDTNADPDLVMYPIPGNDDAIRSIRLITSLLAEQILAGRRKAGLPVPEAAQPSGNGQVVPAAPSMGGSQEPEAASDIAGGESPSS